MNKNQNGSVHVLIVAVLAVILIGVLGYMFWSNFINKPGSLASVSNYAECIKLKDSVVQLSYPETCVTKDGERFTNTDQKMVASPLKKYCTPIEKICFDYPNNWSYTSQKVDGDTDGLSERIIISDQTGKPWLRLQTGLTGVGGSCGNEDNSYIKIFKTHTTKITGSYLISQAAKEYMVDTMYVVGWTSYNGTDKKWTANMELNNSKAALSVGKKDICDLGIGVFNGKNAKIAGTDNIGAIKFGLNKDGNTDSIYETESDATNALSAPDAMKAYDILQSARYE